MAEEPQGLGAAGTSIVSILLAVAAVAFFGQRFLLQDTRPVVQAANSGSGGVQRVDARLWEDPFFATQRYLEAKGDAKTEAKADVRAGAKNGEEVDAKTFSAPCPETAVPFRSEEPALLVLLPGGPYEQAAETRRRTRYAVLSALHAAGIEPMDPEHLGCLRHKVGDGAVDEEAPFWAVPYERFGSEDQESFPVVWVDENRLRDLPNVLTALRDLTADFQKDEKTLRVIGPYSSMLLRRMARDDCPGDWNIQLYNYGATMDQSLLGANTFDKHEACAKLLQVVNTDDAVARLLDQELSRRVGQAKRVALVGEIDTTYGRELSESVRKALDPACPDKRECRVHSVGYLRGLDGSLPRLSSDPSESAVPVSAPPSGGGRSEQFSIDTARSYEQAEGNGQLDYLERLPGPLRELERSESDGGGEFGAIGLLGSDVYDKLLLLRALRPRFPKAVFFTTDLDARLFDPRDFAATRGLIVASSFGLRLAPLWQGGTPSFRDSYQTSAFLATRLAICECPADSTDSVAVQQQSLATWHLSPELYEIGRWGPAALGTGYASRLDGGQGYPGEGPGLAAIQLPVNERARASAMTARQLGGYWGLTLAFWTVLALEFRLFRYRLLAWSSLAVTALTLVLLGVVPEGSAARNILTGGGIGEPLSLTNGISLWPVVGIRILGSFFCLYSIVSVTRKLNGNAETLEKEFDLSEANDQATSGWRRRESPESSRSEEGTAWPTPSGPNTDFYAKLRSAFDTFVAGVRTSRSRAMRPARASDDAAAGPSIYDADASKYRDVRMLWSRLSPGDTLPRHLRTSIYTASCFVIFAFLCMACDSPHVPARGSSVLWTFWVVTGFNVLLMQYLVMLVFDATTFSSYFVRKVRDIDSKWTSVAIRKYADRSGLRDGRLLSDWIDIRMIATRTGCIIELIYFPFVALSIFTLSLSAVFDDVPLYPPVLALAAGGFGLLLYIAIRLRTEAEKVRSQAMERVRARMLVVGAKQEDPQYLETLLDAVKTENGGAFKRLSQQPALRAVALPLSSLGGSALLQQFLVP